MAQLMPSGRLQLIPPEPELIERAQQRDTQGQATPEAKVAFEELYRCYRNPIYTFLCYTMTSQHDAEDVVAEAFTRAWEALPRKKVEAPFIPWLMTIVLHERSKLRLWISRWHPKGSPREEDQADLEGETAQRDLLLRAFRCLTQKQRTILLLHFEMGFSPDAIAEVMHIEVVSVPKTLSRASRRFRERYRALKQDE